jgi:hypothetical protein
MRNNMLSQSNGPETISSSRAFCRYVHARVRRWLEDLEDAGDGAWVVSREQSSEMNVVGDVIDPEPISRITDETTNHKVVGCYTGHSGKITLVIEFSHAFHKCITNDPQTMVIHHVDEMNTKKRMGLVE